jgi:hypothetical protein
MVRVPGKCNNQLSREIYSKLFSIKKINTKNMIQLFELIY